MITAEQLSEQLKISVEICRALLDKDTLITRMEIKNNGFTTKWVRKQRKGAGR